MPVHLYGHPANMDALRRAGRRSRRCCLFEDAAQAHGASLDGRRVGTFGEFAMFSLYPTKNMTSGEGGMVSTGNAEVARRLQLLRNQGMERQYENELVGLQRPDDRPARRDRPGAAEQGRRLDRAAPGRTPRSWTRTWPASARRRSPTARCTSTTSTRSGSARGPGPLRRRAEGRVQHRLRRLLPDPEPPAALLRHRPRTCR